jgi:putative membrane protein
VVLFSWVAGAAAAVVNYYDFHLVRTGDELQYERGLLQRYDGSIPFDKLQTLTVEDTPLKRHFGYATLLIETAGYAPGQSSGGGRGSEAAVPLAERDRVFALANAIDAFGDPDLQRPPKRVRRRYAVRYLLVVGVLAGVLFATDALLGGVVGAGPLPFPWYAPVAVVPVVPFAAHLKWVHRGYWLGDHHVVTRNGVLKRQTKVVPYDRIQTVIDTRTIFQRRWRIATVTIDTAGSLSITGGDAAAVDVDEAVADDLRAELDERLRIELAERRTRRTRDARSMATVDADAGSALPDDGDPTGSDTTARGEDGAVGPRQRGDVDGRAADNDGFVWGEALGDEHDAPSDGEPRETSHGDTDADDPHDTDGAGDDTDADDPHDTDADDRSG